MSFNRAPVSGSTFTTSIRRGKVRGARRRRRRWLWLQLIARHSHATASQADADRRARPRCLLPARIRAGDHGVVEPGGHPAGGSQRCDVSRLRRRWSEGEGPSVLVRKAYKDKFSAWGNYYVDMISSASIDVVTTASPYTEEREEISVGLDYLHGKTFMGLAYTNSEESDYSANAVRFGISQDFFGDLTTLGISYAGAGTKCGATVTTSSGRGQTAELSSRSLADHHQESHRQHELRRRDR